MGFPMATLHSVTENRPAPQKYSRLERLLGETDEAYKDYVKCGGHMNGDFADFAVQSINSFQRALRNPYLTVEDLAWALRKCDRLKPAAEQAGVPWTILAAACLSGKGNLVGTNER